MGPTRPGRKKNVFDNYRFSHNFFYDRSVGFPGAKHNKKSLIWGSLLDVNCVSVIICWKFQQAIIEVVKIRAKDQRAKKLGVPPRTLWSNDQDPVLLVFSRPKNCFLFGKYNPKIL